MLEVGHTYTISALADKITHVFASTRRKPDHIKLRNYGPGDYYYYNFLYAIHTRTPLEIKNQDIENLIKCFPNIELQTLRTTIDKAVSNFAVDNGFDIWLDRAKENKTYFWRIVP